MKDLDFVIIGAQKCATTTLFEHLRQHPDICMPLEKEVPFFNTENCTRDDWDVYAQKHFTQQGARLWGKATPQYMCDTHSADNIKALMPNIKLIAILRDPIERTWSHYQMGCRRELESRDFESAVSELLQEELLLHGRSRHAPTHSLGLEAESDFYIAWSEYGRILDHYMKLFGEGQVLVLYTEDLEAEAQTTLDRLLQFIGLEAGFCPPTLGQVIHRGGSRNLIPSSFREWLRQRKILYRLWQLLPQRRRGRLRFLYEQWNVRKSSAQPDAMPIAARDALAQHYAQDLRRLMRLPIAPPPWVARYSI